MVLAAAAAVPAPFPEYPQLDEAKTRHILAVVEVLQEDSLPPFPECSGEALCFDPPPTWFRARVLKPVHGEVPAVEFFAATTSHFGARLGPKPGQKPAPQLMALSTDGRGIVMPRYANEVVFRDARGDFHLIVHSDEVVHWLPCGMSGLITPIQDAALTKAAALSLQDHFAGPDGWDPEFFRVEGGFAHPRFAIPVARLAEWLSSSSAPPDLDCRNP